MSIRLWSRERERTGITQRWLAGLCEQPEYARIAPATRRLWLFEAIDSVLSDRDVQVYVANPDGQEAATSSFTVVSQHEAGPFVWWIDTLPVWRRQGLAQRLLAAAVGGDLGARLIIPLASTPEWTELALSVQGVVNVGVNPFPLWARIPWGAPRSARPGSAARRRMLSSFVKAGYPGAPGLKGGV